MQQSPDKKPPVLDDNVTQQQTPLAKNRIDIDFDLITANLDY